MVRMAKATGIIGGVYLLLPAARNGRQAGDYD